MASTRRRFGITWYQMTRLKSTSLTEHVSVREEPRFHTIFDLVLIGLVTVFPISLFVFSGHVSKDYAGPSAILSVLFSAMASGLAGLSYSELRARVCRLQSTAYEYSYRVVGEATAFTIGWLLFFSHVMCSSALARAISQNFDFLLDSRISNFTITNVGEIPQLSSYLDFVGFFICLLTMVSSVIDIKLEGKMIKVILTGLNIFVLLFSLVVGVYHLDFNNWQSVHKFFPEGIGGVMQAAVVLTYAFWGSETILRSCDLNIRGLRKPAMMSILIVHIFSIVVLILQISAITLLTCQFESTTPFAEAFSIAGMAWMRYIICTAAIIILTPVLLYQFKQSVTSLSAIASDGLLPSLLADKNQRTDTSIASVVLTGVMVSVSTLLFSIGDLIQFLSMPIVLIQMVVCAVTICFHYKAEDESKLLQQRKSKKRKKKRVKIECDRAEAEGSSYGSTVASGGEEWHCLGVDSDMMSATAEEQSVQTSTGSVDRRQGQFSATRTIANNNNNPQDQNSSSDTDIDDIVEEYEQDQRVREITENSSPAEYRRRSSSKTYKIVCIALFIFVPSSLSMGLVITEGSDKLSENNIWMIMLLFFSLLSIVISTFVIARQPKDTIEPYTVMLYVPHVPWTPLVALVMNIMICAGVAAVPAVAVLAWLILGIIIYMTYGIRHSHESRVLDHYPEEHRGLIHQTSSQRSSNSSSRFIPESSEPEATFVDHTRDDDLLLDCS